MSNMTIECLIMEHMMHEELCGLWHREDYSLQAYEYKYYHNNEWHLHIIKCLKS